jgi:hypothetical protein
MELIISIPDGNDIKMDGERFQKMLFVYNALEEGWSIKKNNDSFVFSKNHEGKKEVFLESYLNRFIKTNFNLTTLLK